MTSQDQPSASDEAPGSSGRSGDSQATGAASDLPARPFATPSKPNGHDAGGDATPARTPVTQQIGRGVVVLLAVAFGVFAVANAQHVEFSWLFGETQVEFDASGARVDGGVPLIVLLVGSLAVGVVVGMAIAWQRARSNRRAAAGKAEAPSKDRH